MANGPSKSMGVENVLQISWVSQSCCFSGYVYLVVSVFFSQSCLSVSIFFKKVSKYRFVYFVFKLATCKMTSEHLRT